MEKNGSLLNFHYILVKKLSALVLKTAGYKGVLYAVISRWALMVFPVKIRQTAHGEISTVDS